jgi:transposase
MMGERQVQQADLFCEFSFERHVPETHLLRAIDRFVDLDRLRVHLAPFYSEMGRPSVDPELLTHMLIVGYYFGIRSETAAVRRGPPEPGVSLALPTGARRVGARPLDLL